jgi:hypothetical protein
MSIDQLDSWRFQALDFKKLIPNLDQMVSLNVVLTAAWDSNETNAYFMCN